MLLGVQGVSFNSLQNEVKSACIWLWLTEAMQQLKNGIWASGRVAYKKKKMLIWFKEVMIQNGDVFWFQTETCLECVYWNVQTNYRDFGMSYSISTDRPRMSRGNERSIVTSVYNRIALDVAALNVQHVRLDENGRFFRSSMTD